GTAGTIDAPAGICVRDVVIGSAGGGVSTGKPACERPGVTGVSARTRTGRGSSTTEPAAASHVGALCDFAFANDEGVPTCQAANSPPPSTAMRITPFSRVT